MRPAGIDTPQSLVVDEWGEAVHDSLASGAVVLDLGDVPVSSAVSRYWIVRAMPRTRPYVIAHVVRFVPPLAKVLPSGLKATQLIVLSV